DGAPTFKTMRTPHGDNHDLWIAPDDPLRMIASDDGGAHVTYDGGATWSRQDNQPTAQFYHVTTDSRFPYYVYGAQQDNSTVAIASRTGDLGIGRTDWYPGCRCGGGSLRAAPHGPKHVGEARRPERGVRRLLRRRDHALRPPHGGGPRRHRLPREPDGLGRRGHEVPLPVDGADHDLAPRPRGRLCRRQRPLPDPKRRPEL